MLIPFKSKAAADFFMLHTNAAPLFELMGKPFTPQGVIAASDTALCLTKLRHGLDALLIDTETAETNVTETNDATSEAPQISVGLKQRAWPLMDMLERASRKQVDVLWGVAT